MSRTIPFNRHFHAMDVAYRRRQVIESLTAVCRANGLKPPGDKSTDIYSDKATLANAQSGDTVCCISILDLAEIDELATVVRGLLSRGVRIVTSETPDLVNSVRIVEALCASFADLVKRNKALEKQARTADRIVDEARGFIAAQTAEALQRAFAKFNEEHLYSEYGTSFLRHRRESIDRLLKKDEPETADA